MAFNLDFFCRNKIGIFFLLLFEPFLAEATELLRCVRVGYGAIAPLHEDKMKGEVVTIGIIDSDPNKKEEASKKGVKVYESYRLAWADHPDFWDICTPAENRMPVLEAILSINEPNLILEKPVCSFDDIQKLKFILNNFKGKISVNENYLCSNITKKVQELANKHLIKIHAIEIVLRFLPCNKN